MAVQHSRRAGPMSHMGQSLPKSDVRAMSGLPPETTESRHVPKVPIAETRTAAKERGHDITSFDNFVRKR
jgi:hypothetical protein